MKKVIVLPGFSAKNKDEALAIQQDLKNTYDVEIVSWPHWETGQREEGWIEKEAEKIANNRKDQFSIIAKSIGTAVATLVVEKNPNLIEKLILCGIPLHDLNPGDEKIYQSLSLINPQNILCIQNQNDPHASFAEIYAFVNAIHPTIHLLSKTQNGHEYLYSSDFKKFLN